MGAKDQKPKKSKVKQPSKGVEKSKQGERKKVAPLATDGTPPLSSDSPLGLVDGGTKSRLDRIKESHSLLKQFSSKELKILLNLKRNTSPKAWTLREDLIVLTLAMSNREIAEILKDRNKEAVKKRLQLLRSKGLTKRQRES